MPRIPQLTKEGEARSRTGLSAPAGTCAETSGASEPENASCEAPPAMLVVEEDEGDFMLLKRALYKVGATARVWWSREPGDALSILEELQRSSAPVCVVMEVHLGACDGWDLLGQIKAHSIRPLKCALLTGLGDDKTRRRAEEEGIDAFFVKPCDSEGLAQIARQLQKLATSQ